MAQQVRQKRESSELQMEELNIITLYPSNQAQSHSLRLRAFDRLRKQRRGKKLGAVTPQGMEYFSQLEKSENELVKLVPTLAKATVPPTLMFVPSSGAYPPQRPAAEVKGAVDPPPEQPQAPQ